MTSLSFFLAPLFLFHFYDDDDEDEYADADGDGDGDDDDDDVLLANKSIFCNILSLVCSLCQSHTRSGCCVCVSG